MAIRFEHNPSGAATSDAFYSAAQANAAYKEGVRRQERADRLKQQQLQNFLQMANFGVDVFSQIQGMKERERAAQRAQQERQQDVDFRERQFGFQQERYRDERADMMPGGLNDQIAQRKMQYGIEEFEQKARIHASVERTGMTPKQRQQQQTLSASLDELSTRYQRNQQTGEPIMFQGQALSPDEAASYIQQIKAELELFPSDEKIDLRQQIEDNIYERLNKNTGLYETWILDKDGIPRRETEDSKAVGGMGSQSDPNMIERKEVLQRGKSIRADIEKHRTAQLKTNNDEMIAAQTAYENALSDIQYEIGAKDGAAIPDNATLIKNLTPEKLKTINQKIAEVQRQQQVLQQLTQQREQLSQPVTPQQVSELVAQQIQEDEALWGAFTGQGQPGMDQQGMGMPQQQMGQPAQPQAQDEAAMQEQQLAVLDSVYEQLPPETQSDIEQAVNNVKNARTQTERIARQNELVSLLMELGPVLQPILSPQEIPEGVQ